MKSFLTLALLLSSISAFADQCQALSSEQASRAALLIQSGSEIASLCQNCGEAIKNAQYSTARSVSVVKSYGDFKELSIAGETVDLAYTYLKVAPKKYVNVALVVGCPASGVSKMILRK